MFVADGPLTVQRFAEVLDGVDKETILTLLQELQSDLEAPSRGLRLVEVAGGYQLRTAKVNADWVKKFLGGRPARMGRATLETLAIIAYRQPITKAEIESIRGVDVDGVITTLLGAKPDPRGGAQRCARPAVSLRHDARSFCSLFNLKDLTELPTLKEMDEISLPEISRDVISLDQLRRAEALPIMERLQKIIARAGLSVAP